MSFRIIAKGALVDVTGNNSAGRRYSEGGRGVVEKKKRRKQTEDGNFVVLTQDTADSAATGETVFQVKYTLDNRRSPAVKRARMTIARFDTVARSHGEDDDVRPSLLSTNHRPAIPSVSTNTTSQHAATRQFLRKYSHAYLIAAANKFHRNGERLIIYCLKAKKKKDNSTFGWLRKLESSIDPPEKSQKHLTEKEKTKAMHLVNAAFPHDSAIPLVAYAWGVHATTIRTIRRNMIASKGGISVAQKVRSDKGKSILNSEKKRHSIYTPFFVFCKLLRQDNPDTKFTREMLHSAWNQTATMETKEYCAGLAQEWLEQGPYLVSEITKALWKTRGAVSWTNVATLVAGSGNLEPISDWTIRTHIMALPDSSYKSTKILPKLDKSSKLHRYWWSLQFWIFWESSMLFDDVQIILVHMDEKWSWSIVVRNNLKSVPFLGIEPVIHGIQNASHLDKGMVIASTAFAPQNNDYRQGGEAYLVSLTRVGKMVKAEKDTYRRVYKTDGSGKYHYPKVEANRLRTKGEYYFKTLEITGSSKGTRNEPKFDLVSWFDNTEIPALEALCQRIGTETGKKCIIRYQMDNAGPHSEAGLQEFLQHAFEQRGWMLTPQPPNSAMTNTKDDSFFPALSKRVSREQGITNGSQNFTLEEMFRTLFKCWRELPRDMMARAYVRHFQIAAAIGHCMGGDEFARKSSVHCNVRNCCLTVCDEVTGEPIGVEVVQAYDPEDENDNHQKELKYKCPTIPDNEFFDNLERMTWEELLVMEKYFPDTQGGHGLRLLVRDAMAAKSGAMAEEEE